MRAHCEHITTTAFTPTLRGVELGAYRQPHREEYRKKQSHTESWPRCGCLAVSAFTSFHSPADTITHIAMLEASVRTEANFVTVKKLDLPARGLTDVSTLADCEVLEKAESQLQSTGKFASSERFHEIKVAGY
tara:strand:- start:3421 stop:3819 length:399 start_codon:yes stop_codon:yes gene_type:complete